MQRIKLLPKKDSTGLPVNDHFRTASLPTGVVCGVYGKEVAGGKFEVEDIVFPIYEAKSSTYQENDPVKNSTDGTMILMSGLGLGAVGDPMPLELALSWITGEAGEMLDQEKNAKIERVILAGNSLSESMRDLDEMSKAKYLTKDRDASSLAAVRRLDDILFQLANSVDVDLMPGANDPTNQMMPQQPLHHCLFPRKHNEITLLITTICIYTYMYIYTYFFVFPFLQRQAFTQHFKV